jgi:hypothetical protein
MSEGAPMTRPPRDVHQLVAALGVVLSLLFVGWEIRQNTRVARASAVQTTQGQIVAWQTETALDDDWIRIQTFLTEGGTFAELSAEDRMRYNWVVASTVRLLETRYRQTQLGIMDPDDLGIGGGTSNPAWFQAPAFLDWWRSADRTRQWAPDFLEFFETEVLEIR